MTNVQECPRCRGSLDTPVHPRFGDSKYGGRAGELVLIPRYFLHLM